MRPTLLDRLACPVCAGRLALVGGAGGGGEIEEGEVRCESCGRSYPVTRGIPRLVPSQLSSAQQKTAEAFGWQWKHFVEMHPKYEEQFLDWVHPLAAGDFRGRLVLDAGCGIGRHAFYAARYGASEVIALDLSEAVETARETLRELPSAHVVQGDLLRPPLRSPEDGSGLDLIYSIGVLHHLPDPRDGFRSLVRFLRPGGVIAVWVYGYENNGFVRNVVEPMRRVTTRVPPPLLRTVAFPLAAVFHGVVKGIYGPTRDKAAFSALPLREYVSSLADYNFRQNYNIVFDQLVAPTAAYIKGEELRAWFEEAGLEDVEISHRHGNSWRGRGRRPA